MSRVNRTILPRAAFCSFVLVAAGLAPRARAAGDADPSVSPMRSLIDRYQTDRRSVSRYYTAEVLPAYRERMRRLYEERRRELEAVNFDGLDQAGKVDYLLLRNDLAYRPKQLVHEQKDIDQAAALLPFANLVTTLEEARRAVPEIDAAQAARTLTDLTRQITSTREVLEQKLKSGDAGKKDLPSPVLANRAARLADEKCHSFANQILNRLLAPRDDGPRIDDIADCF